jgi:hypothetical protein
MGVTRCDRTRPVNDPRRTQRGDYDRTLALDSDQTRHSHCSQASTLAQAGA